MKEKKLASTIINYSLNVKENEFVLKKGETFDREIIYSFETDD